MKATRTVSHDLATIGFTVAVCPKALEGTGGKCEKVQRKSEASELESKIVTTGLEAHLTQRSEPRVPKIHLSLPSKFAEVEPTTYFTRGNGPGLSRPRVLRKELAPSLSRPRILRGGNRPRP